MPAKPTKYGIKVWMVADYANGYVANFSVYLGSEGNEGRANMRTFEAHHLDQGEAHSAAPENKFVEHVLGL